MERYGTFGKSVFVEQKTHHEQWVDQPSVKERFQLDSDLVKAYLEGTFKYEELIPRLKKKGITKTDLLICDLFVKHFFVPSSQPLMFGKQ